MPGVVGDDRLLLTEFYNDIVLPSDLSDLIDLIKLFFFVLESEADSISNCVCLVLAYSI